MRVTPVLRSLYGLVSLLAVTVALLLVPATSASAAGEEQDFINRLNALRASAGLPGLTVYGDLTNVARGQSVRMGQQNLLYHNPNLTTEVTNWLSVGENVGYGGSVAAIHDALVNSPGHRANMLSSTFTQVGIGTYFSSTGRLWVTQVFRKPLLALAPQPVGFPLGGAIGATYPAVAGVLGAPTSGEYNVPGGRGQNFQHGEMLWSWGTGAREVHGGILSRYRVLGGPWSPLALPTTHENATPDGWGRYNHFQGGSIYWSPPTGAFEVRGGIRGTWSRLGWERSALGYPVTDELGTPDRIGRFNHFERGSIYWTPGTGAREIRGAIRNHWAAMGWERGLGYPVSDEYDVPGGRRSDFQRGSIVWDARTGATRVA